MGFMPTGLDSLDRILSGGIQRGLVTEVICNMKEGRSNFCFSLCARAASMNEKNLVIYGDTQGTFRPEKILKFLQNNKNSDRVLSRIRHARLFSSSSQKSIIDKVIDLKPVLVVIDNFTSLFLHEYKGISRHFSIINHLHQLSLAAIKNDIGIVVTNVHSNFKNNEITDKNEYTQTYSDKEFGGNTISFFTHMIICMKRLEYKGSRYSIQLVRPHSSEILYFIIKDNSFVEVKK